MLSGKGGRLVGRLVGLWRYPVKSMRGEALTTAEVSWHGVAGDRRWAFLRNDVPRSGFPWFTLRERADMGLYRPRFVEPELPNRSATVVLTPSGRELDVTDPALAEEICPGGMRVMRQDRGVFDTFALSLITTQTIGALGARLGVSLDPMRFRPNLLLQAVDDEPFPEDAWVGCELSVGGLRMRVDKRDGRCAVITIDPTTTERNPDVLRAVAQERQGCLGVYGSIVQPGSVTLQDPVLLWPSAHSHNA